MSSSIFGQYLLYLIRDFILEISRWLTWISFYMHFHKDVRIRILSGYINTPKQSENALLSFIFLFLTLLVIWSFIFKMKSSYPDLSLICSRVIGNSLAVLYRKFFISFSGFLLQSLYLQVVRWITELSETFYQHDLVSSMVKIPFYNYDSVIWFISVAVYLLYVWEHPSMNH